MRLALFSATRTDRQFMSAANAEFNHELVYFDAALNAQTAALARGFPAVCAFVNDRLSADVLDILSAGGTRLVALRCAGFNNVDLAAADRLGLVVARVPAYSPHAVAEHAVALMLALNRKLHRAFGRVREQNFELEGLLGFDLHGRTVGVVGTGRIGEAFSQIMAGFGCRLLGFDVRANPVCEALGMRYVSLHDVLAGSDVVALHCPLTPQTRHLIGPDALACMKPGAILINTSRGGVVDSRAVIEALKSGRLGGLGIDVYEEEGDLFFRDLSDQIIRDDVFTRLQTFPNVVITAHQAFYTRDALTAICATTLRNVRDFECGEIDPANLVSAHKLVK